MSTELAGHAEGDRLSPAELRKLFLFEKLDAEQLDFLASHGAVETHSGGTYIYREGEPATCFYVLLSGTVALSRTVRGDEVETTRTDQVGAYAGATQAYIERIPQIYLNSMLAVSDVELYQLPADQMAEALRDWFPMAMHLLEGLFFGMRSMQTAVSERERLLALGSLSAGLTHELNNPAAAAVRATSVLRTRFTGMRNKLALIADGRVDGTRLHALVGLQDEAIKRAASAPELTPMETSDAEDKLGEWLEDQDIAGAWDIAPTLVSGAIDSEWLQKVRDEIGPENFEPALRWLTYTLDTEQLMTEIDDAVTRISSLVAAAKQYSQLDRAPHQTVNVHELLHATLVMLHAKFPKGIKLVKDYDRTIPEIPAYAAELNQVWTNLIDNAISAMGETGTLTVRTSRDGDNVVVSIGDTGPGIPKDVRPRIFDPFFTTKPVGEGTGLGLDISYRIVVNKHHGDIRVDSKPGETWFHVVLPTDGKEPDQPGDAG
ncbi:cyclic nucleotide-binding protein [Asanoa ferruginea]|uniref:histidine kinase n=1 Tax=Asanoa ferruginea TaxID=53367 RepID=A0A3D9ZNY7_9ACTN|nr:ATP-binding protein [Asanoa ferruginea]REF98212.1 cyclic nucleotide-binding protein [Asanoa ferruginea]GIF50597.1 histidine kinase [Asanoa ferruginea]